MRTCEYAVDTMTDINRIADNHHEWPIKLPKTLFILWPLISTHHIQFNVFIWNENRFEMFHFEMCIYLFLVKFTGFHSIYYYHEHVSLSPLLILVF